MQKIGTAGPLIVMDVVTSASRMSENSTSMSAAESIATPQCPTSPSAASVVAVAAHQRRHVERDRQSATAGARIIWYRSLVCSALPNPANCRIVQGGRGSRWDTNHGCTGTPPASRCARTGVVAFLRRSVDRIDLEAGKRREVGVTDLAGHTGCVPSGAPPLLAGPDLICVHRSLPMPSTQLVGRPTKSSPSRAMRQVGGSSCGETEL